MSDARKIAEPDLAGIADKLQAVAITRAGLYVCDNPFASGKASDITAAAECLAVAAALRAIILERAGDDQ